MLQRINTVQQHASLSIQLSIYIPGAEDIPMKINKMPVRTHSQCSNEALLTKWQMITTECYETALTFSPPMDSKSFSSCTLSCWILFIKMQAWNWMTEHNISTDTKVLLMFAIRCVIKSEPNKHVQCQIFRCKATTNKRACFTLLQMTLTQQFEEWSGEKVNQICN